jgi:hypothetical protein
MSESICIEDFCGSWHGMPVSFSADYFPTESLCYFTGDWDSSTEIPPMPSASVPTEADVYVWARKHGSGYQDGVSGIGGQASIAVCGAREGSEDLQDARGYREGQAGH